MYKYCALTECTTGACLREGMELTDSDIKEAEWTGRHPVQCGKSESYQWQLQVLDPGV